MKLLYIANSRFPSERAHMTQIVHMCNAFYENGYDVTLLVTDRHTTIKESPEVFFGIPINFKVIKISVPDIAGNIHRIPSIFRPSAFMLQRLVFSIYSAQYARNTKQTVVYGRDEWILFFLSFVLPVRKLVYESHEAKFNYAVKRILRAEIMCVCISEGIYEQYLKLGIAQSQMIVAHDGVDDSFLRQTISKTEARKRLGLDSKIKIAMYIGSFATWKGVETFFEASTSLKEVSFVAIGGSKEHIEKYKREYSDVQFLGQLPYKDLKYNQSAADVLVIPNTAKTDLSFSFTSPLKLFAHMASKVPLVVSNIPSLSNVLSEDDTYFFEPDSSKDLAAKIMLALENIELSQQKVQNAYEKIYEYSWLKRAQKISSFVTQNR